MIRIDVSFSSFTDDYAIPNDNPFVGNDGVLDEIWASACATRSASASTARRATSTSATSARTTIEEIDVEPASSSGGRNYGWDVMEGTQC